MAFVNEYVSQEDIEKYGLVELKNFYYAKDGKNLKFKKWQKIHWCIDREREIWLAQMHMPNLPDPRDGGTGESFFVLHYKGINIELDLRRVHDETTSIEITDRPFKVKWKLEHVKYDDLKKISYEEVVEVLREILSVYGGDGIVLSKRVPSENQIVELQV